MARLISLLARAYVMAVFAFIFIPLLIIVVISFSADSYLSFPPSGWSLKWYGEVLSNEGFMQGLKNSAIIAAIVALLSLGFGLPAAYALERLDFPGRTLIRNLILAPLILPAMMLGLGILMVFTPAGLVATYPGLVLAHLVMTLPFSVRILQTTLSNLGTDVEEGAMTLGARP
ncbi:MAG: ABC transporter permease, partial [Cereibacter changlensis]